MGQRNLRFLRFKLYHPPLSRDSARTNIVPFVDGVIKCVKALHYVDIAHLDIRLENVCFDDQGSAVLIDLDRSTDKTMLIQNIPRYGKSEMYSDFISGGQQLTSRFFKTHKSSLNKLYLNSYVFLSYHVTEDKLHDKT